MYKVLNLTDGFRPISNLTPIPFEVFEFPSGCETHIKMKTEYGLRFIGSAGVVITTRITNSNDIMRLLLATNALRNAGVSDIQLFMPYVPYARQDRLMVSGEPFSMKVFADVLNLQNYSRVYMLDPHSNVAELLINNSVVIPNSFLVREALELELTSHNHDDIVMVSPDAGAYKKIYKTAENVGFLGEIVLANKIRNVATGEIVGTSVDKSDLGGIACLIVDDICSRGGTFMGLAKALKDKNAGDIILVVSHYEGTANEQALKDSGISRIYKTNSMNDYSSDFVTNIKFHGKHSDYEDIRLH